MRVDKAKLRAYLDGELSEPEREFVEKLLTASPQAQAALAQMRRDRDQVAQTLELLAPTTEAISPAWWALKQFQTRLNLDGQTAPLWDKNPSPKHDDTVWESPSLPVEIITGLKNFRYNWRQSMTKGFVFVTVAGLMLITGAITLAVWPGVRQQVGAVEPDMAGLGGHILFQKDSGIYAINPDGTYLTRLASGDSPTSSPDGRRIAFLATYNSQPEIYVMNSDGTNPTRLTYSSGVYLQPVWSPDGQRLAFVSGPSDKPDIYIINADGTNQVKLTDSSASNMEPQWSPDGQYIAFASYRNNQYDIYIMNVECTSLPEGCGTNLTRLTDGSAMSWRPVWSPDGRRIAFLSRQGEVDNVYVMNANGANPTRLTDNPPPAKINSELVWSPDGQRLAFALEIADQVSLYTVSVDGVDQTPLTENLNVSLDFAWSPDSQRLAFISYSEGRSGLFLINVDGTHLTPLAHDAAGMFVEWMPQTALNTSEEPGISPTPTITSSFTIPVTTLLSSATMAEIPFGYGIQAAPRGDVKANISHIRELGFEWVKFQMAWKEVEPAPGQYDWSLWDNLIGSYAAAGIKIMLSIPKSPDWARSADDDKMVEGPPADPAKYAEFVARVANRYQGKVQAIEVWNEQNLWYEAGGKGRIDAAAYVSLLQLAYTAIKSVNKDMIVISGGLTPAGNVTDPADNKLTLAVDDVDYLKQLYANGIKDYFDALGAHPSGYNCPALADWRTVTPEEASADPTSGMFVNRHHSWCFLGTMEAYREVMVANGDGDKVIAPTEFGWAVAPGSLPGYDYARDNTYEEQAQWITEAYRWAKDRGWVGPMILWNLDYGVTMPDTPELAVYGILDTPAFEALVKMPK